jgi:nucleotide-binding universal stress UspA family protein
VVVPPGFGDRPRTGRVLLGLQDVHHADRLLSTGFEVAERTGSELVVQHVWHLTSPYANALRERTLDPDWEAEQVRAIEERLAGPSAAHPDVKVRVEMVHGQAAYELVTAGATADLLMISRPAHGGFVHYLGSTARAVIREAPCPVEVVPPVSEVTEVEHSRHETAGPA